MQMGGRRKRYKQRIKHKAVSFWISQTCKCLGFKIYFQLFLKIQSVNLFWMGNIQALFFILVSFIDQVKYIV